MKLRTALIALLACAGVLSARAEEGWTDLFDGKTLDGWKANEEDKDGKTFTAKDGELVVKGGRAHLFYVGKDGKASFKNFEFKAKVLTKKNANSGIYIHTEYQKDGWPSKGYECQVNNSYTKDPKSTGGIYAIKDVLEKTIPDDKWFDYEITVKDKKITVKINGKVTAEFEETAGYVPPKGMEGRKLGAGTFAFQAHDPGCEVHYKDIKVKALP